MVLCGGGILTLAKNLGTWFHTNDLLYPTNKGVLKGVKGILNYC